MDDPYRSLKDYEDALDKIYVELKRRERQQNK
jgi:hypothetical protein